jgi:hypothetical protein
MRPRDNTRNLFWPNESTKTILRANVHHQVGIAAQVLL